jgi:hypothetical protein
LSYGYPPHLVECDLVARPVIQLRRLRRLVAGHLLGFLRGPAILPPLPATIQALKTWVFISPGPVEIPITRRE